MQIYVIRHGQTLLNVLKKVNAEIDEPLNVKGIAQAKAFAPLVPKGVVHIYSSSLLRAKQTATSISSGCNVAVSFHDELTEIRMGSLAGKAWKEMENGLELKKKHRAVAFDYHPYGGEAVTDVKKRLLPFLQKISMTHRSDEALLVTHGGIIRLLYLLERGELMYETEKNVSLVTFNLDLILREKYR